jgi:Bacterial antitoxin of type II TA system, VapB
MLANLAIDDSLIKEACQLSGQQNASDVATKALQEYVQRRKQLKLLELFGTVEYHDNCDIKEQRNFKA